MRHGQCNRYDHGHAANTVSAASSTPTLCINTALTPITHTTTGATGIGTATGLPAGVTAAWAANTITISGTPTASGTFNYTIPLTGGCGTVNATGTITVTPANTVRCGLLNTDIVYQHSTDPDNPYNNRSDRNRHSHRVTNRSNCSLGNEYYHDQWYTDSIRNIQLHHTADRRLRNSQCNRYNNGHSGQYSRCGLFNPDVVYQHSTDPDHPYHYRRNRNRHSHGVTSRSYSSMGNEYDHHQWHTDSIRNIQLHHTT